MALSNGGWTKFSPRTTKLLIKMFDVSHSGEGGTTAAAAPATSVQLQILLLVYGCSSPPCHRLALSLPLVLMLMLMRHLCRSSYPFLPRPIGLQGV